MPPQIRVADLIASALSAGGLLIKAARNGETWTSSGVLEYTAALKALAGYVSKYIPGVDDPLGRDMRRLAPPVREGVRAVAVVITELLVLGDARSLSKSYTSEDLSDTCDLQGVLFGYRVVLLYVLFPHSDGEGRTLHSFEHAFLDPGEVRARAPYLAQHWNVPLAELSEPELRILAEKFLDQAQWYDFWNPDLFDLAWHLETLTAIHVVFWQDQSELEHRRILYSYTGIYRGIMYCQAFRFTRAPPVADPARLERFRVFWEKTTSETVFSDIQQKQVLLDVHATILRPGEIRLYEYVYPAEEASPAALMTSAHSGRTDAVLSEINVLTDMQPRDILKKSSDKAIQNIVLMHIIWLTAELRAACNLKEIYLEDPSPSDLEQCQVALVRVANRYAVYTEGRFLVDEGPFINTMYLLFETLRETQANKFMGRTLLPMSLSWVGAPVDEGDAHPVEERADEQDDEAYDST